MLKVIVPLAFFAYKFIFWYRYNRLLSSIIKISSFKDVESILLNGGEKSVTHIIVSLYSKINSVSPLLLTSNSTNQFGGSVCNITTSEIVDNITNAIGGGSGSGGTSDTLTQMINFKNEFLAIESTTSLVFECSSHSSAATISSAISQQYNSVPNFTLTDLANQTIDIISDDVVFPLEKSFSNFTQTTISPSTFTKVLEIIFGKRKYLGKLVEARVLKPNLKFFTVLSCKVGKFGKDIQYRLMNLPFQFSENKFETEISNSKFKTILYGGVVLGITTGLLVYYGTPMIRDYLFKLKMKKQSTSYEETQRSCSVCYECARDVVFLPCSHVVTCYGCSAMIISCPICRQMIQTKTKIIFS